MFPASNKAKFFAEIVFENSNLNDSDIFLLAFPSGTNLKLRNIPIISKMLFQEPIWFLQIP